MTFAIEQGNRAPNLHAMTILQTPADNSDVRYAHTAAAEKHPRAGMRQRLQLEWLMPPYATKVLSALSLVGIWYFAAWRLPSTIIPPPHAVVDVLWQEMMAGPIWGHVSITLTRIVLAFSLAMTVSLVAGFAMGLSRTTETFLEVWIVTTMVVPSLVIILTIYMVVGLNDKAAVIAAAVPIIPIVTINVWQSIKSVDVKLVEMSKVYRADRARIIRSVIAPQIAPALFASARFGLGLVWKTVLFVELLGRSDGIGYQIQFYYNLFNMGEVLAHALLFLFIMLFLEMVVLGVAEKRFFRWRPAQQSL
jgi:NitT/TauT family transport system permease protein